MSKRKRSGLTIIRNNRLTHVPIYAFTALSAILLFQTALSACPGCKEALFDPGQLQQRLSTARGYALSIGVMLSVPLALIGGVAALIIRGARRGRAASGKLVR